MFPTLLNSFVSELVAPAYFACLRACAPCMYMVPTEIRRGLWTPLGLELTVIQEPDAEDPGPSRRAESALNYIGITPDPA